MALQRALMIVPRSEGRRHMKLSLRRSRARGRNNHRVAPFVLVGLVSAFAAGCGSADETASGEEQLAVSASPLVGKFVHAPATVAPPQGAVRSALLELEFTTQTDAHGHLVFHEKERSDDVHGSPLKRTGYYTATATAFTLHLSEELSYDYDYQLDAANLVYWSADSGERKEFLVRR
jgi:hypothetical protein